MKRGESQFMTGQVVSLITDRTVTGRKVTPGRQGVVESVFYTDDGEEFVMVYCGPLGQCLAFRPEDLEILHNNSGEPVMDGAPEVKTFGTGAVRSSDADGTRFDLVSPVGLERLARAYADGAVKYGVGNWKKGIPASDLMNHCLRHLNLYLTGDRTEDHLSHATWNLFTLMDFESNRPDMMDIGEQV